MNKQTSLSLLSEPEIKALVNRHFTRKQAKSRHQHHERIGRIAEHLIRVGQPIEIDKRSA